MRSRRRAFRCSSSAPLRTRPTWTMKLAAGICSCRRPPRRSQSSASDGGATPSRGPPRHRPDVRSLLQRVDRAAVRIEGREVASIGPGLLILLGVGHDDTEAVAAAQARRATELRIFADEAGKTNRSIVDIAGSALVVSQFTLYADTSRGRRPGFTSAAPPDLAERLYKSYAVALRDAGVMDVQTGAFGAEMLVELVNDGPFTIWVDSDR